LEKAVSNLAHLDELYKEGDVKRKRVIIGSIYPEKLTFDGFQYRTTRVNEAVELIYTLDKGYGQKETGQTAKVFDLSCLVDLAGFEPVDIGRQVINTWRTEDQNSSNRKTHAMRGFRKIKRKSREDRIRTCDPLVPNQVRYRPALLPERIDS